MEYCERSNELRIRAERVLRQRSDLLYIKEAGVRIGFEYSDQAKTKRDKIVFGDCSKVKPREKAFMPAKYDFIICFYEPNSMLLDDEQQDILMWHELKHIGITPKGNFYVVPHDVEDFSDILREYGLDWAQPKGGEMNGEES